jgi:hypothetical protein
MSGYTGHENELGIWAMRLHYTAAEDKNPLHPDSEKAALAQKWLDAARRIYPDPHQWAQEMEINWWVAAGTRVYPEFTESLHTKVIDGYRQHKVIYRAWDFGWHAPVCLVAQIDSQDRLIVLKEIVGKEKTTKQFAQEVIKRCAEWFSDHAAGYKDFCDPAGQKVNAGASEQSETRDVEILNVLKIYPSWEYGWSRKDGRSLVHQLLQLRVDGTPSMYVNPPGCPVLLQGFLGKYVYPPRKGGMAHDEPDENCHPWADCHAAMRYLATGLYSALGLRRAKQPYAQRAKLNYSGYGTPIRRQKWA